MPKRATHASAARLGTEPIGKLLWRNCTQTTIAVGVFGVYALTNAWFVARGVGANALAAVNLTAPLLLLVGAVSTTIGVGGASLVSRHLGAGRPTDATRAAANAFLVFWCVAVAFTAVALVTLDPLLRALGASGVTLELARPYARVIVGGAIFSTGFSALVRAEGRLTFSMMLWVVPVLVQIMLDPLFIFGLDLGITGAALGTVGGQVVSASMAFWFFFIQPRSTYPVALRDLRPDLATIRELVTIGAPSFLAGFGSALLAALVNNRLAATASTTALATFAVAARVQIFVAMPQVGIAHGLQPIIGYNTGHNLPDRVRRAQVLALRATTIYGTAAALVVIIFAEPIAQMFLADQTTAASATTTLRIIAGGFAFSGIVSVVSTSFQAAGHAKPSYLISVGTLIAIQVPLVIILSIFGGTGVLIAVPAGEAISALAAGMIIRRFPIYPAYK